MARDSHTPMGLLTGALDSMRMATEEITVAICGEHFERSRLLVQTQAAKACMELVRAAKRMEQLATGDDPKLKIEFDRHMRSVI